MSGSLINVLLAAAVPGAFSIWVAWLNLRSKQKSDAQSAQGDYYRGLETRIDALQCRMDELQAKLDEEIEKRRVAQDRNFMLKRALQQYVAFAQAIRQWIDNGSIPPPPEAPTANISKLLEG
ncbi:hypothetical protein [Corynebacterium pseudopelargi]|uniref:Uncharacterized protein n=1 Tax=Corynebacterium pseudopelargi TaxID=2080757 RepID=A0A3G6IT00_9CORY|nr:hypothetical protein [Corynebacterium pseudopelargi]AZA08686.1 hypothetical protein CPPEL_02775 [Corynebacterium pseudopelargi]